MEIGIDNIGGMAKLAQTIGVLKNEDILKVSLAVIGRPGISFGGIKKVTKIDKDNRISHSLFVLKRENMIKREGGGYWLTNGGNMIANLLKTISESPDFKNIVEFLEAGAYLSVISGAD
jgi:hypothetical protein